MNYDFIEDNEKVRREDWLITKKAIGYFIIGIYLFNYKLSSLFKIQINPILN